MEFFGEASNKCEMSLRGEGQYNQAGLLQAGAGSATEEKQVVNHSLLCSVLGGQCQLQESAPSAACPAGSLGTHLKGSPESLPKQVQESRETLLPEPRL
jgi:hypothetical protein